MELLKYLDRTLTEVDDDKIYYLSLTFQSFYSLQRVNLPNCANVPNFSMCRSLTYLNIGNVVAVSSNISLTGLWRLSEVHLPKLRVVPPNFFSNCTDLSILNLANCEVLGNSAFYGCSKLTSLIMSHCKIIYAPNSYGIPLTSLSLDECIYADLTGFSSLTEISAPVARFIRAYGYYASSVYAPEAIVAHIAHLSRGFSYLDLPKAVDVSLTTYNSQITWNLPSLKRLTFTFNYNNQSSIVGSYSLNFPGIKHLTLAAQVGSISLPDCMYFSLAYSGTIGNSYFSGGSTIWDLKSFYAPECLYFYAYAAAGFGTQLFRTNEIYLPKCRNFYVNTYNASFFALGRGKLYLPECVQFICGATSMLNVSEVFFSRCAFLSGFSSCTRLGKLVILSPYVCHLSNGSAFNSTPMVNSTYLGYYGSVYVPSSLVSVYKSAMYWSQISNRITAYIEE